MRQRADAPGRSPRPAASRVPAAGPAAPRTAWLAFAVLAAGFFMTVVDVAIVNVALPTIGRQLDFAEGQLQWVISAYALAAGGFLLLGGRAADLLGRRRVFLAGVALFTAASLGSGLAGSPAQLIGARAAQGLGAALISPAAVSILRHTFDGQARNRALAIWGALAATGATVGVTCGGVITRLAGWQWIFFVNVPAGIAVLALAPRIIGRDRRPAGKRRYDIGGAALTSAALALLTDGLATAPATGWTSSRVLAELTAAGTLGAAAAWVERRSRDPLVPPALLRNRALTAVVLVNLLFAAAFFGLFFTVTLYMQQVLGYSALQCGTGWLAATLPSVAAAGPAQRLVAATSPRTVLRAGITTLLAAMAWFAVVPAQAGYPGLAGGLVLAGIGVALTFIPLSIEQLAATPATDAGVASALVSTAGDTGSALGVAVLSSVVAGHLASAGTVHGPGIAALTAGLHHAFWAGALIAAAALACTLRPVGRPDTTPPRTRHLTSPQITA